MYKALIGAAIALLAVVLIVVAFGASKSGSTKTDTKAKCEAAIQAIADRGGESSTPKECKGLTDAEVREIALRVYADKDRDDKDQ